MCRYNYSSTDLNKGVKCTLNSFFKGGELPVDEKGVCIFHSGNIEWKRSNDFTKYLNSLLEYSGDISMDLREVIFIADSENGKIFDFPRIIKHDFEGATFYDEIVVSESEFDIDVEFFSCNINTIRFIECKFDGVVNFSNIKFDLHDIHHVIEFDKCKLDYFSIDYVNHFNADLILTDCVINEQFSVVKSNLYGNVDLNCKFLGFFEFTDVNISSKIINFSASVFEEEAVFNNVSFDGHACFDNIKIENTLLFKGDETNKVFYNTVDFEIVQEDIFGALTFEYVNLQGIREVDRFNLLELQRSNKVVSTLR